MKTIILFILSSISLKTTGQIMPRIEEVIYDKDRNIIASLDYFGTYGHIETIFRDTITNIRYKLDQSHHFVTALSAKNDTLWNVDPYKTAREEYTLETLGPPLEYENLRADSATKIKDLPGENNKTKEQPKHVAKKDSVYQIIHNMDRPDHITQMKFGRDRNGETVLYIKADARYYGFLDLKTGKFYPTRRGW